MSVAVGRPEIAFGAVNRALTRSGKSAAWPDLRNCLRSAQGPGPGISMKRRKFLTLLGSGAVAWPAKSGAQQAPAIGFLSLRSAENDAKLVAAFNKGLAETAARTTPTIEYRFAGG